MIKIKLIDCGGHMYVKLDGTNGPSIYSYLFDGVQAESTHLSDWVRYHTFQQIFN